MDGKELTILKFKVSPEDAAVIEKAMSSVRGNIGSEASILEERGKALALIARIVLSDYNISEKPKTDKTT